MGKAPVTRSTIPTRKNKGNANTSYGTGN